MSAEPRLNPDLTRRIVSYIRAGGYDWVAAQAVGVPRARFHRWMKRGAVSRRPPYREFYLEVEEAKAHARLSAEIHVREKDAKFWLRYGLGREAANAPGWSVAARPSPTAGAGRDEATVAWVYELMGKVADTLAPFAEAKAAVERMMETVELRLPRPDRPSGAKGPELREGGGTGGDGHEAKTKT